MKKILRHLLLAVALVFGVVFLSSETAMAAPKPIRTYSDFPVKCYNSKGAFHGKYTQKYNKPAKLQGWVAADAAISDFTSEFEYAPGCIVSGSIDSVARPDVKAAYPSYKYCLGFVYSDFNDLGYLYAYGKNGTLRIYAMIGGVKTLVGQYDISSTDMITCSDFPITVAPKYGCFVDTAYITPNTQLDLQGWVAAKSQVSTIYGEFYYKAPNANAFTRYLLPLKVEPRKDVKAAYPSYAYCIGYKMDPIYSNVIKKKLNGDYGFIRIYAMINGQECFIGEYNIFIY
ncbi:MAG: hypothetical protein J5546_11155 [Lachnospiraceae bacterium]|nr:hypothetical protein [Lachnospiraceae bacterium]